MVTTAFCPYKGDASYYDIMRRQRDDLSAAVWYRTTPLPAVADIKGHVAFYADRVTVNATPCPSTVR